MLFYGYPDDTKLGKLKGTPNMFIHNAAALGDLVASLGCLKFMHDNYFTPNNISYSIAMKPYFWNLFYWVPRERLLDIDKKITLSEPHAVLNFNDIVMSNGKPTSRIHPIRMALWDYASIKLFNRVLPLTCHNYPKLPISTIDISKFNLPEKYVVFVGNYSAENRQWVPKEVNTFVTYLKNKGIATVFVGKSKAEFTSLNVVYKVNDAIDYAAGLNLMDQTTLYEVAKVMDGSLATVALDCGLLHLAGCTSAKIIGAYTNVDPLKRATVRHGRIGYNVWPITPDVGCKFCQSRWGVEGWDFNSCYEKHLTCIKQITAEKMAAAFEDIQNGSIKLGYNEAYEEYTTLPN